jgi:hypothetical protein
MLLLSTKGLRRLVGPSQGTIMADIATLADNDNIALLYAFQKQYDKLTDEERTAFGFSSLTEIIAEVQNLDLRHRAQSRIRRYGERFNAIITGLQCYFTAIDTLVSSHPDIAGLVWGGLRFVITVRVHLRSSLQIQRCSQ